MMQGNRIFTRADNGYGERTSIDSDMYLSPAFLSLGRKGTAEVTSSCSVQLLIMLLGKRQFLWKRKKKIDGNYKKYLKQIDSNQYTLTHKETEYYGIPQGMRVRGIDELLAKGFNKIHYQGGAFDRDKTIYSLVDDWMRWYPGRKPFRTREKDIPRGFQGKGLGVVKKASKQKQHALARDTHTHIDEGHTHAPIEDTSFSYAQAN